MAKKPNIVGSQKVPAKGKTLTVKRERTIETPAREKLPAKRFIGGGNRLAP